MICEHLEANGVNCWIAPRDVPLGQEWAGAIIEAIEQVRIMVLLVSGAANESRQVSREVERAVSKGLVVIPVRLADVPLSKSLEYYLSSPHWLDATKPPLQPHLARLTTTLQSMLNLQAPETPAPEPPAAPPAPTPVVPPPSAAPDRRPVLAVAGLLIAVLIGVVVYLAGRDPAPVVPQPVSSATATQASPTEAGDSRQVIHVKTAREFLRAIGPNRIIEVAPGEYNLSGVERLQHDYLRWQVALDIDGGKQWELVIQSAANLTIRSSGGPGSAHLYINEPYAYVLTFQWTDNLTLSGLKLGHFPDPGYCLGGVVRIDDSQDVRIEDSILYGCGTEGLTLRAVKRLAFSGSTIKECTYGIITAKGCEDLTFENATFSDNQEFHGFDFGDSRRISFTNCEVTRNRFATWLFTTDFSRNDPHGLSVAFVGGSIHDNSGRGLSAESETVFAKDTDIANNDWQLDQ